MNRTQIKQLNRNDKKCLSKQRTIDEIKKVLDCFQTTNDPEVILKRVGAELDSFKEGTKHTAPEDNMFKAMTLYEFQNGMLLMTVVPEAYNTFGVDMLRKLQEEYRCTTISEQATAELATISYIRTLEIQSRITQYIALNALTDNGVKFLAIMSKELDRANRHYLTAIQTLRMLKQPSFNVNVKANTAIVGQNQVIQENQNVNPI